MIKRSFIIQLIIIEILLKVTYAQDSISNKFHVAVGADVIPGLSFGWSSEDYRISLTEAYNKSVYSAYISSGLHGNFYFNRTFLSTGLYASLERINAHGEFFNVNGNFHFIYSGKYLEIPLAIGFILNKNYIKKQTYIKFGSTFGFIFYERINKPIDFIQHSYLGGEGIYEDRVSKKFNYNRTCILITLGRETPFIKNTSLYFKRALTFITPPINIKRNTTEIFTYSRFGIELGISYKIK